MTNSIYDFESYLNKEIAYSKISIIFQTDVTDIHEIENTLL